MRRISDDCERKVGVGITIDDRTRKIIETCGVGKSFSDKLRDVVRRYHESTCALFRYDSDNQREMGNPTILRRGAIQVYCETAGKHGLVTDDLGILEILHGMGNKKGNVAQTVAGWLEKAGYTVQVSEDPIDVWAIMNVTDERKCSEENCAFVKKIKDIMSEMYGGK